MKKIKDKDKYIRAQKMRDRRELIGRKRVDIHRSQKHHLLRMLKRGSGVKYKPAPSKGFKRFILVMRYFFNNLITFLIYRILAVYTWFLAKISKKRLHRRRHKAIKNNS